MPAFRKMSPAEIAVFDQPPIGPRAQVAREYDAYLVGFAAGDYGQAALIAGAVSRCASVPALAH